MDLEFDIIQNGYTICPDTWGMTDECATFYRIYYVKGGKAYLHKNGGDILLLKEHLYIFPVMQPYTLWQDTSDPLEVLWFHTEMNMGVLSDVCSMKILPDTSLYHLLNSMIYLHREPNCFGEIVTVFQVVLKKLDEQFFFSRNTGKRMKQVVSYIEEHIQENPKVSALAECAGMERSYFARFFKERFGMSPRDFVYAKKMSVGAKALLAGMTVEQAALSCGYTDEKAFSRAFKKYMDVSPGKYKKCHIEQP